MVDRKFMDSRGRLTAYALACGYVQRIRHGQVETTLWHEGAIYHVLSHDFGKHTRLAWESFQTLGKARAAFCRQTYGGKMLKDTESTDMLEALKSCVWAIKCRDHLDGEEMLRAACAKAESLLVRMGEDEHG